MTTQTKINTDTLNKLIERNKDDKDTLDFIFHVLMDFESYHKAVFEMESKTKVYSYEALGREDYQEMVSAADKSRTSAHNSLLGMVNALNRLAVKNELPPFYDGIVSEEKPYRREVANAIFKYVQRVIENRI